MAGRPRRDRPCVRQQLSAAVAIKRQITDSWLIDVSEEWCFGEFLPILIRQRDHARDHGQADRAALFDGLIQRTAATERS